MEVVMLLMTYLRKNVLPVITKRVNVKVFDMITKIIEVAKTYLT